VAFRAFPSQSAVTPLGALCSPVVSACAGFARASSSSTFAPALDALRDSSFAGGPPSCLPAQPRRWVSASARDLLHRSGAGTSERLSPPTGDEHGTPNSGQPVPERPFGAPSDRLEPATSELCSDRESVLEDARLGATSSRCSLDLWAPPRSANPVVGLAPSPLVLAPPTTAASEDASAAGFAALQGVNPTEPGSHSEDRLQPPWGLQPLPIPQNPPAIAGKPLIAF
jgi:hypothetical protein